MRPGILAKMYPVWRVILYKIFIGNVVHWLFRSILKPRSQNEASLYNECVYRALFPPPLHKLEPGTRLVYRLYTS